MKKEEDLNKNYRELFNNFFAQNKDEEIVSIINQNLDSQQFLTFLIFFKQLCPQQLLRFDIIQTQIMCVNDYQFRHYSAIQPKQCRRFIFVNQDDIQKTFLVNISQFQEDGQIALCKIINHLSSKGLLANKRTFFLPKFNLKIRQGDKCKVPFQNLSEKQIIFRAQIEEKNQENSEYWSGFSDFNCLNDQIPYKKDDTCLALIDSIKFQQQNLSLDLHLNLEKDKDKEQVSNIPQARSEWVLKIQQTNVIQKQIQKKVLKRNKQSQRSIFQVLLALKKWRKLYESKKMNLIKAAKLIGISKKSLDDYYLVIRIGQVYNFDFQSHLNGKMGEVRSFIKKIDSKVPGKLTKQIKCFELLPEIDLDSLLETQQKSEQQIEIQ